MNSYYYADGIQYSYYSSKKASVSAQNTNIEFAVIPERIESKELDYDGYIIPTYITNFKKCGSLQYVTMPSTIKEIRENAFLNCI